MLTQLRILFLGDIVGEPGRKAVMKRVKEWRDQYDVVIVNGENAAGGRGITSKIANELFAAGVDAITMGDHVWDQAEILEYFGKEPRIIRPLNYPEIAPGKGYMTLNTPYGKVGVMQAQGRTFMNPALENPFLMVERTMKELRKQEVVAIVCDFHAETTSETIAFGRFMDGKVSLVVGTHTHVQTADERIFPGGTGFLTDAGMCGPDDSVLGRSIESVVWRFQSCLPTRFPIAKGPVRLCGVAIEVDVATGHCTKIVRISELQEEEAVVAAE